MASTCRAVNISPDNGLTQLVVWCSRCNHVSNKTIAEVDITYFVTPWSAELILTYPQKHDVELNGKNIGTSNICHQH
jgi:outer membrane protein